MLTEKGLGIVEVIFSVGVIVLVITGVTTLIVKTNSVKTAGFNRKIAGEMAEVIVENLVEQKKNDSNAFWQLIGVNNENLSGFNGYNYSVGFSQVTTTAYCNDLGNPPNCADAYIDIRWGDNQILSTKRFFTK